MKFNFEYWKYLFETDPELFELKRKELIQQTIKNAPLETQQKLNEIQNQIEKIRENTKTPLEASSLISQLMAKKLNNLQRLFLKLNQVLIDAHKNKQDKK